MTNEEIVEGLKLLEDNMVHFDELQNDKGEWIDVHELLFEAIQALEQQPSDTVSRGVFEQVMWERDVAIGQLKELGYELGQKVGSCDDAISCEAVIKWLKAKDIIKLSSQEETARKELKALSPVTPQQKYGKWIKHPEIETSTPEYLMFYECSECGDKQCFCKSDIHKKRFCSNCGAKMQESEEV